MEFSVGQKQNKEQKQEVFVLASISELSAPSSSSLGPVLGWYRAAQLQFLHESEDSISINLSFAQLFKVGPILSICMSGDLTSDASIEKYSRGVNIQFRNVEESRSFHRAFYQWQKECNLQGDGTISKKDYEAVQKKMKKMSDELDQKREDIIEELNQTLIVKERQSNYELQGAREELIAGLAETLTSTGRTNIGIKRMGEIEQKPFLEACKQKFPIKEAKVQASMLCSLWQDNLQDQNWYPFKIITDVDGKTQEIIDEEDEELCNLKQEWGEGIYAAVTTALKEMNDYNPSGRYVVQELWNFKERRKAELKEVVAYMVKQIKTLEHKRDEDPLVSYCNK